MIQFYQQYSNNVVDLMDWKGRSGWLFNIPYNMVYYKAISMDINGYNG